jgi:uncharacterized protein (DUF433 family)
MDQQITIDPKVALGKPCVAGTRITVELILERLGAGESFEQLLEAFPNLSRAGILAALSYAASVLTADAVYPVGNWLGEMGG